MAQSHADDPVADSIATELARRSEQLGARSEVEVASDALWILAGQNLVTDLDAALVALGLRLADLKAAEARGQARWLRFRPDVPVSHQEGAVQRPQVPPDDPPPAATPPDPVPAPAEPEPVVVPPPPAGPTAEGKKRQGHRSKQPRPKATTMVCSACGDDKTIVGNFSERADRPGKLWTICDECRAVRGANRYLSVDKEKALNMARLKFVIAGDEAVGLACIDCGNDIVHGDYLEAKSQLRHVQCPTT